MAHGKPELIEGFVQVAHELDAALDVADFSKAERIILREVKAQCFGVGGGRVARINARSIALRYGYKRQFSERGLKMLIATNFLAPQGGDLYAWNKYYRTWKRGDGSEHPDGNGSRFSDVELSQIATAPEIARGYADASGPKTPKKKATIELHEATIELRQKATIQLPKSNYPVAEKATIQLHPPTTPYKEEYREERERENFFFVNAGEEGSSATATGSLSRRDRIVSLAESIAPLEGASSKVDGFIAGYGEDWTETAILCGMVSDRKGSLWQYVHKCLMRFKARGGPLPADVEAARSANPSAIPNGSPRSVRLNPAEERRQSHAAAFLRRAELARAEEAAHADR